jgi:hypothetical protein
MVAPLDGEVQRQKQRENAASASAVEESGRDMGAILGRIARGRQRSF